MDIREADVLIIGAGAAGLRAAIELHDRKINVAVITKSKPHDPHTVLATGGINAALGNMDPEDTWLHHAYDTVREGVYLSEPYAVELLCKNVPRDVAELVKWGARFERSKKGELMQRFFGAQLYRRACFYGDYTGREIIRVLTKQAKKRKIPYYPNMHAVALLKNKNTVNGVLLFNLRTRKFAVFHSMIVVLAAGGYSRVYKRSSSRAYENFGDGIRLAYEAGAELQDMEMVQFHPTGMIWPLGAQGTLVTEAVRGEGGRLFNKNNERFMKRYDQKRMELSARDVVARSIYQEIESKRCTGHGGVWLDITHLPKKQILKRLPRMYKQFMEYAKLDITKERMEVAPTSHYTMGGVMVDFRTGATSVKGLFCIGENTSGLHGANRLGGNSLGETVVFGRINAEYIAKNIRKFRKHDLDIDQLKSQIKNLSEFNKENTRIYDRLKSRIQQVMWDHAGIVRDGKTLRKALKEIQRIDGVSSRYKNISMLEIRSMLISSEALIRSAIFRKESRGAHYRKDYPETKKLWKIHIIIRRSKKGMDLYTRKVSSPNPRLKKFLKNNFEAKYHYLE